MRVCANCGQIEITKYLLFNVIKGVSSLCVNMYVSYYLLDMTLIDYFLRFYFIYYFSYIDYLREVLICNEPNPTENTENYLSPPSDEVTRCFNKWRMENE